MERKEVYKLIEDHYRRRYDATLQTVRKKFRSYHDAEDVVQEAYTRACQYWDTYEPHYSISTWIDNILNNCIKDQHTDNFMRGHQVPYKVEKDKRTVSPSSMSKRELERIDALISTKPEHMQRILRLHFFQGYDLSDIEQIVPEKYHNIHVITKRFREELRESK